MVVISKKEYEEDQCPKNNIVGGYCVYKLYSNCLLYGIGYISSACRSSVTVFWHEVGQLVNATIQYYHLVRTSKEHLTATTSHGRLNLQQRKTVGQHLLSNGQIVQNDQMCCVFKFDSSSDAEI